MGLSGRKQKQRIGNDPRNLSWADDAARFGSNYLSKFGWNSSQGLGADGEGRTSHLKVAQKLDMLGIGAAHTKDPNGIAWKQNKDFENLLARLNGGSSGSATPATKVDGFASATVSKEPVVEKSGAVEAMDVDEKDEDGKKKKKKEKKEKKDKKRKRGDGEEEEDGADTHKKAKVEEATPTPTPAPSTETTDSAPSDLTYKRAYVPRHRAHRARAIAAKSIASKSTNHISEILGVAPESSATSALASESATPPDQGKLTVISDSLEKLTTSTKSVADYFKERLMAKAAAKSGSSTPQTPADSTPSRDDEEEEKPRGGLGFAGIGMRRVEESSTVEDDTLKLGLSKFSSLMSSTFLSSAMSFAPATQDDTPTSEEKDEDEDEKADEAERKRLKKEEKAKRKAEKAKKKAEKAAAKAAENSSEEEESKRKKEKKSKKKNKKKEKSS